MFFVLWLTERLKMRFTISLLVAIFATITTYTDTIVSHTVFAQSQTIVSASIDSRKTINKIDEKLYSHFLEHIYNSCNGGLWGELVWNRSLEAGRISGWSFENGILKQDSIAADCRYVIGAELQGDSPWTDYDVRIRAKKISGLEGFLIMFRVSEDGSSYYWLNLGGWENKYVAIEKETPNSNGRHVIGGQTPIPPIKEGQLYDIRILIVGQNIKVFVNQDLIHEIVDFDDNAPKSGCIGVGTWNTKAEFHTIQVRDLQRKTLFSLEELKSFTPPSVDVRYWSVDGNVEHKKGNARNSSCFLRFNGHGNLSQKDYSFQNTETYDYSFWARGKGKISFNVLQDDSLTIKSEDYAVDSNDWTKYTGVFTASHSTSDGKILFNFKPIETHNLDIDQISVFPRSWKENSDGLRPDLLDAIAQLNPPIIRWPGGCYASAYRWKSGIGPQDDRVAFPIELWNDVDVNSFGIDEFIPLCRRVGAEPLMVVNIGTAQWIDAVGDPSLKSVDWIQEVCDWVEYCNGEVSTKWGAVRAQNGHPEPYKIKYWEIDNEVRYTDTPSEKYVDVINKLVPRMKAIDPSIQIIACGSWMGDKMKWDSEIIKGAGKNFDFLSTHRYDDPNGFAFNPWDNQRFFEAHREMIENSDNPNIKIFNSEWNAQSTDWRTGLHAGGFLNCCERVSDIIAIAAPALFLRHKSATGWDNAFINFDNKSWFPAPNYVVMKLWRDSYAPYLLEMSSDSPELNGDNPIVNAVATKTQDEKTIFVKIVNNSETDVDFHLSFDKEMNLSDYTVSASIVSPQLDKGEKVKAKLFKRNTFESPDAISVKELATSIKKDKVVFKADALSALVVKLEAK